MKSASCATFANFDFWRVVLDEAAGRIVVQNMSGYTTRTTVLAEGYIWLHDKNNIVLAEGYVLVTRHEQHCVG